MRGDDALRDGKCLHSTRTSSSDVEIYLRFVEKVLRRVPGIYHGMFPGSRVQASLSFTSHILQQMEFGKGLKRHVEQVKKKQKNIWHTNMQFNWLSIDELGDQTLFLTSSSRLLKSLSSWKGVFLLEDPVTIQSRRFSELADCVQAHLVYFNATILLMAKRHLT